MATLWDKGIKADKAVEMFTVGKDRELDLKLAKYDVKGSKAHIAMLEKTGLLTPEEHRILSDGLDRIYESIESGSFRLEEGVEDIHSQVELLLTEKLGDVGKKIHSGRSRNDQVALDLKLFLKDECLGIKNEVLELFNLLIKLSDKYKDVLLPGYTHFQIAMPSSFGLWLEAYAEALADDMLMLKAAYRTADSNPLGSAAGYGSSFPLDREMTTRLLGFSTLSYNSIAAQMGRGKTEKAVAAALGQIAGTLNKLAQDCCLYMCPNFSFISFPDNLTTGSSIMPHKKNPDVFELLRAHCNRISGIPGDIRLISGNLPSGYFRDMQLIKELFIPMFDEMSDCLDIACFAIENIQVKEGLMDDPRYALAFSVEKVNALAASGVPFRDAYKQVAAEIGDGSFSYSGELHHTHQGSIGNLCNDAVAARMQKITARFGFDQVDRAVDSLLG